MLFLLLCQQSSVWKHFPTVQTSRFSSLVPASAYGGSLFTYAERPAKPMQVLLTCEDTLTLALKKGWNAAPCQRDRAVPVTELHVRVWKCRFHFAVEVKQLAMLPLAGFSFSEYISPSISYPTRLGSPCFKVVGCAHDITFFGFVTLVSTKFSIKKAECQRIDAFELWCWGRLLRVPWTARRSNQSILKSWIFRGRTDAEAETPILWPPDEKNWLIGKDPDAGKDWRWEEKGTTEDEMVV